MLSSWQNNSESDWHKIALLLQKMGQHVCRTLIKERLGQQNPNYARSVSGITEADTIYGIDRWSEDAIFEWMEKHWTRDFPVEIIAEGLEDNRRYFYPPDTKSGEVKARLIIDPIDGTRELMYDKRSAWFLAAVGPVDCPANGLQSLSASAMVELPTEKQQSADMIIAWRQDDTDRFLLESVRWHWEKETVSPLPLEASTATDLFHGFTSFVKFFPEGKPEIVDLESEFFRQHLLQAKGSKTLIFDDQYISTGGQFYSLLKGQYRMVADLRPLIYEKLYRTDYLTCHPYDLAGLPVLKASGVIIEDPWGEPLNAPLDTTTPVAWVAYANKELAANLRPLLEKTLLDAGYSPNKST